jgi:hypothetical protein
LKNGAKRILDAPAPYTVHHQIAAAGHGTLPRNLQVILLLMADNIIEAGAVESPINARQHFFGMTPGVAGKPGGARDEHTTTE